MNEQHMNGARLIRSVVELRASLRSAPDIDTRVRVVDYARTIAGSVAGNTIADCIRATDRWWLTALASFDNLPQGPDDSQLR